MKQTKWQRLATIGLCSSLVINAFSGVTAVAETITIESSPTVASSAKEATSASSATPASTESSQETTETSREEVTQETEKPEELREDELRNKSQIKDNNSLRSSGTRALAQMPYRAFTIYFVSEDGSFIDPSLINMSANIMTFNQTALGTDPSVYSPSIRQPISIIDAVDHKKFDVAAASYTYSTNSVFPRNFRGVSDIKITVPKKYSDLTVKPTNYYSSSKSYPLPVYTTTSLLSGTVQSSDSSGSLYELTKAAEPNTFRENYDNRTSYGVDKSPVSFGYYLGDASGVTNLIFGTTTPIYYYLTNRRVTESFKDTAGAIIPAPTGFTQGKQTSITSNNYTFKQAGTLPETYKASNGKTYKFKGWYKGKTKPNTLTTTKAPSYAVTYDDNDDLNVVYEEAFEFPEETFQFGFVNQDGQLVKSDDITIAYDYSRYLTSNGTTTWNGIDLNQKAITDGKLKKITMPKSSMPLHVGEAQSNGEAMINISFSLPKYYTGLNIYNKSGKIDSNYPLPPRHYYTNNQEVIGLVTDAIFPGWLTLAKAADNSYVYKEALTSPEPVNSSFPMMRRGVTGYTYYYSLDAPVYYHLTQRKVTENFVDATGAKITPPTGFTQGKQTGIDSDPYTFKQAGTLPDTYKAGTKTYKFKGWYKGKTKPSTLTTTKAPSYAVTYDDNDDLNVVYEEINFPETTYQFGFVNEAGQLVNPDDISLTYDYKSIVYRGTGAAGSTVSFGTIANNQSGVKVGNLRQVTLTAKNIAQPTVVGWNGEAFANFSINLPKYYKSLNLYDKTGKIDPKYPLPVKTTVSSVSNDTVQPEANVIAELTLTQRADGSFTPRETYSGIDSSVRYPPFLRRTVSYSSSGSITALYQTISGPVYYHLTNRKVTENFVNTSGAKITPPAGFTQGNQIPMTSNTFKYTSAKALPDSYSAGGKTYVFQGWYKGKTKPNTLTTSTTPAYNTTFDDNDDMTAVYKEANISANLTMRGAVDVIDNGATMEYWEVLLKNTGEAPLTSVKIKPTTDWAAGISTPTELFILGTGQNTKVRPITKEQWEAGFEIPLDSSLPVGGQLTINLLGTKVTGQPNQVLKAAVEVTGNFNKLTASDTVRIKDLDQETKEPTGEGFISVPTFNFGQVGVAGSTQQHSLKKAADYYGNGTRNPYLRIKKTQPNWSLTAQLSQPKSATDSLPTATRLLLGAAPVSSFSNYNQPTELKNAVGTTSTISLNANNTATRIIANQQFTGSNIYQLDFTFNNVKLEVPANQGVKGQQYQAAITWNLVTGP
ncbi:WxL domain-containing protein [Enterococcus faecalis]|uniref:WxL domain-containing protein n=2 Tax=Enterococcus faecalis TaxID=1351 RepID=UPI000D51301F|nr:WxL domain-containing protein [Enterococcus faecalis]EIR3828261.1 WxL domain-containing protein [Enterococcus faecalis]ELT8966104.1 WxL domain-containing protein [Enterococcus faecalis]MBO6438485.1 WxL domain-containing protein [Enterococcus faecalis]MEB7498136.1 WxL domain-containing protein [Enterococcus faecalis]NSQ24370.1 WxL domain-containing protein [Enterococcus faecalis]